MCDGARARAAHHRSRLGTERPFVRQSLSRLGEPRVPAHARPGLEITMESLGCAPRDRSLAVWSIAPVRAAGPRARAMREMTLGQN